jgi:hypothetical protein
MSKDARLRTEVSLTRYEVVADMIFFFKVGAMNVFSAVPFYHPYREGEKATPNDQIHLNGAKFGRPNR